MRTDRPTAEVDLDVAAERFAASAADDPAARAELVELCLPMARRLALRYTGRGEPLDDLEQAARLGLVKAVNRYVPERGSFTAFAVITMLGELRRHFRDRTWAVRAPRRLQDLLLQIRQTNADVTSAGDRAELADRFDTTVDEVELAVLSAAGYTTKSLNAPIGDEDTGAEYGDLLGGPDPGMAVVEDRLSLRPLLDRLPERERTIVTLRFFGNYTQTQIAEQCGISQMHVSRLLSKTLTWLRHAMLADTPPRWGTATHDGLEPPLLSVTITGERGGVVTVAVGGEVDRDSADDLRQAILDGIARRPTTLLLDMSGVPFIDAAGVAALAAGLQEAARAAVTLTVRGTQPHVRRVLAATRLPLGKAR